MSGWQRSSFCSGGACVRVVFEGESIVVSDSKLAPDGPELVFTRDEWRGFVLGVKFGEFDLPEAVDG